MIEKLIVSKLTSGFWLMSLYFGSYTLILLFSINFYQVIPLSPKCGMLQWLQDTKTLKTFLETDPNFKQLMHM